jgi:integrase
MGVRRYMKNGKAYYKVDEWVRGLGGKPRRFQKRRIPTREQAELLVAKVKVEAFEGRFWGGRKKAPPRVEDLWKLYAPVSQRENDSFATEKGRAAHLLKRLGEREAQELTLADIEGYRAAREQETTQRGGPPAPATLDREVELLSRLLNYAVRCKKLQENPLGKTPLLRRPNVRHSIIEEEDFQKLLQGATRPLQGPMLTAFDTGMRKGEIFTLRWTQVNLEERCIHLEAEDTKTKKARVVYLTTRVLQVLSQLAQGEKGEFVFTNPKTGTAYQDLRKPFSQACKTAGLEGLWFHDLRRSFITRARRAGVPESVIMRMSGHKTRSVFERYNVIETRDMQDAVERMEAAQPTQTWMKFG